MRIAVCVQSVPIAETLIALRKLPFIGAVTLEPAQIASEAHLYRAAGYHVGAFVYTLTDVLEFVDFETASTPTQ